MTYNLNLLCCEIIHNLHGLDVKNMYLIRQGFSHLLCYDKGERISSSYNKTEIWIFTPL